MLHGRGIEQAVLDALVDAVRDGRSGTLVIRGEAGIGKTALLDYAAARGEGLRVVRATGVEFEAELPFAGLHLLLAPVLDRLPALPAPHAAALRHAFGLQAGGASDRFLVGLATLSLLAELAEECPVVCLVDDAQWLDRASAEALAFAARRLQHEGVLLVFGMRDGAGGVDVLQGLPELVPAGLDREAALAVLEEHYDDLAPIVRDRIVAETQGNPLALVELPAALTPEQRAGAIVPLTHNVGALPLTARVQKAFGLRASRLSRSGTTLLLAAAAEETGDIGIVLCAAEILGVDEAALAEAERSGLINTEQGRLRFRHPLARAAVLYESGLPARLAAHRALAQACDRAGVADRRAWHRAAAATGPDEDVAADLEATADRARDRAGYLAQMAALERAAELTDDGATRQRRFAAAAEAATTGGDFRRAAGLARKAAARSDDPLLRARAAYVTAVVEFHNGSPAASARMLIDGADPIRGTAPDLARKMLTEAVRNAYFGGDSEAAHRGALSYGELDRGTPLAEGLLGLAEVLDDDTTAGVPRMRLLLEHGRRAAGLSPGERLIAGAMGLLTGQDDHAQQIFSELVRDAREHGMVGWLPIALEHLSLAQFHQGLIRDAMVNAEEALAIAVSTGQTDQHDRLQSILAVIVATLGNETRCRDLVEPVLAHALQHQDMRTVSYGSMAIGSLELGLGRHHQAFHRLSAAAHEVTGYPDYAAGICPLLVEAASRIGNRAAAVPLLARYERWATASGQPWALGVLERCYALLAEEDETVRRHFDAALQVHPQGGRLLERAHTELLFGEWLRRGQRKAEARVRLRSAAETFERVGARPWADRARAELRATGESGGAVRSDTAFDRLTPQELQVVRLAAKGLSNRDIGGQLFLSPRTVGFHLYKAFPKLSVASRAELSTLDLG